jgi:N utilization substance protein B
VLRPETKARARALQVLYAWELQGRPPLEQVVAGLAGEGERTSWEPGLAIASRVVGDLPRLDSVLRRTAEHWRWDRIGLVERNVLRLAASELIEGETPPRVVIDEAVRLARWYAGPKAPAFVNGVLDAVARRLGRL